jgi:hypothetical protein
MIWQLRSEGFEASPIRLPTVTVTMLRNGGMTIPRDATIPLERLLAQALGSFFLPNSDNRPICRRAGSRRVAEALLRSILLNANRQSSISQPNQTFRRLSR